MELNKDIEKFADLSLKNWPLAIVKFNKLKNKKDFDFFLERWENLGNAKQDYSIILDTRNMRNIGLSCAFAGMKFIGRLREKNRIYLKNVILIYNHHYLHYLFNLVLTFQKPVAKTYTYRTNDLSLIDYVELFNSRDENKEKFVITNI